MTSLAIVKVMVDKSNSLFHFMSASTAPIVIIDKQLEALEIISTVPVIACGS